MSTQRPRQPVPDRMRDAPISVSEALRIGVGRERLRGADLAAPLHGIRAPEEVSDVRQAARAYATRMPRWAAFTGRTAATLMRLPLPPRFAGIWPLEVVVPTGSRAIRRRGITGTTATLVGSARIAEGVRVASPEDVWAALGPRLALGELVAVGDAIIRRDNPWASREALRTAAASARVGGPNLRAAVELLDDAAESDPESQVRVALVVAGISGLVANLEVIALGRLYRLDLSIPRLKIDIEYQGDYHRDQAQWRRDRSRRAALEAEGWIVIELTADHLRRPDEIVALVRSAIARRAA